MPNEKDQPDIHWCFHYGQLMLLIFITMMLRLTPAAAQSTTVVPRFDRTECPMPVSDPTVECGYLIVPEDRAADEPGSIRVAIAIARSWNANPQPDPIVYLHGGPSSSLLWRVSWWLASPFRSDRDVILIDQRGSGFSEPSLDCPEMDEIPVQTLTQAISLEQAAENHARYALLCQTRLLSQGIRLQAYTNADIAADLESLRELLGYEHWNLFAWSAGTRVALTTMRDYPDGIRSVVLDSVYMPPSVDFYADLMPTAAAAFQSLFDACTADIHCAAVYPELREMFLQTVDKLNADPLPFRVQHPFTGELYNARMNGPAFVGLIYRLLYSDTNFSILPKLIADIYSRSSTALPRFLSDALSEPMRYFVGQNQTIHCSDEAPFTSSAAIDAAKAQIDPRFEGFYHWDVDVRAFMQFCDQWQRRLQKPVENEPIYSEIPGLIFAGTLDPASPPIHGRIVAQTLPNSYFFEFPSLGHFIWATGGACPQRITQSFLDDPLTAPDADCIAQMPPLRFTVGAPVLPSQSTEPASTDSATSSAVPAIIPLFIIFVFALLAVSVTALFTFFWRKPPIH